MLAFAGGLARVSHDPILRVVGAVYVKVFRGLAALILLFWFYFVFRTIVDLGAVATGVLVLGLNVGAYGAEVVRAAIVNVPRGQTEAAIALNLTRAQRMRHVILPQAIVAMLPTFGNLAIEHLKATALVSLISIADLTRRALLWRAQHSSPAESVKVLVLALVVYGILSFLTTLGIRALERRMSRGMDVGGLR